HLRPALLSAAAISFLMSFDNFNTSVLLVGSKRTLPVQIYSMLRFGLDPTVNAVAVVLIGTALLIGILSRIFDVSIIKR
ncbi:ABC transporter permease, partial [Candidatus Micrarchaeota archaeon]